MHLNRQIIFLFFFVNIVNRQGIVKPSSIVKPKDPRSTGPKVQGPKGPRSKGQARDQDQTSPADPCGNQGPQQEPGPKVYI
jgi:hypothetical protein